MAQIKSYFPQFTENYFPSLVLSIIEKINEKARINPLTYLHRSMLTREFSVDGRWASITANYSRIAADVVSLDSELPLKTRDTVSTESGKIPKLGLKLFQTEEDIKNLESMIAQGLPLAQIINNMFQYVPKVITAIYESIEELFLSELSSGYAVAAKDNGLGTRINMGFLAENQKEASKTWTEADALPLDDIQEIFDKADEDGNTITDIYADDAWLRAFYMNAQVRGQYAFDSGISTNGGSTVPVLDLEKAQALIRRKWDVELHRIHRTIKKESNGKPYSVKPWAQGVATFVCDDIVGSLVWTNLAEETHPVPQVEYQKADDFILVSRYADNDPLREFTSSQAMVVPVLNNVDTIYTLNSVKSV